MLDRRDHLKIIGAIGASCAFPFSADQLYGQVESQHMHGTSGPHFAPPAVTPFEPKFFTAEEGLVVSKIADLIIPETDSPGAIQAGVPQYIDMVVMKNAEEQTRFREGIKWLNEHARTRYGKAFLELGADEQIALLTPLCEAADARKKDVEGAAFFQAMKNLTADGYYTSYAGLVQELHYKGNQALSTFEGCVHEH